MEFDNKIGESKTNEKIIKNFPGVDLLRRIPSDFNFIAMLSVDYRRMHFNMHPYNNKSDNLEFKLIDIRLKFLQGKRQGGII